MYACCSYGNQYEELLHTAEHLGRRWHDMVKFCETRFAQSELKVYINFEHNYSTYRGSWGSPEVDEEIPDQPHPRDEEEEDDDDWDEPLAVMLQRG